MAYARYQIRVRLRDRIVHSSGTTVYENAEDRARAEATYYGVGAIATVWEFLPTQSKKPDEFKMTRLYEVRLMLDPTKSDGSTVFVPEDHTTPPPTPAPAPIPTPEHHHG
jgi:hypothetical protein